MRSSDVTELSDHTENKPIKMPMLRRTNLSSYRIEDVSKQH